MPKNSNYDFIAMLVIFKHLLNEIEDIEQYIDSKLNRVIQIFLR